MNFSMFTYKIKTTMLRKIVLRDLRDFLRSFAKVLCVYFRIVCHRFCNDRVSAFLKAVYFVIFLKVGYFRKF